MRGIWAGVAGAVSFGASAPLAARLVGGTDPQALSGLLYLGAGLALLPWLRRDGLRRDTSRGLTLTRAHLPRLALVTVTGGVTAPVLLMLGLHRVGGLTGSLLLNLEAVLTIVVAVAFFGDRLGPRPAAGAALSIAGALVLTVTSGGTGTQVTGGLCVAGACLLWAVDNNLTVGLAAWNPVQLVVVKALTAAAVNLTCAALRGVGWPSGRALAGALALGAVSYGLSVLLDAHALRELGAAREAALFATAPFAGALVAPLVHAGHVDGRVLVAGALMLAAVILLSLPERAVPHEHAELVHDHPHTHDEHHHHEHGPGDPGGERHAHRHTHGRLSHAHPVRGDLHH